MILLSSFLDEKYETFVLTLISGKASISYNDVSVAFVNHEVRRKDNEFSSSSIIVEARNGFQSSEGKGRCWYD